MADYIYTYKNRYPVYNNRFKLADLLDPLDGIPTNGLVLYMDAFYEDCYPGTGTTIYDLSGNGNNGSLIDGAGFNSTEKCFTVPDNEHNDQHISIPTTSSLTFTPTDDFTLMAYSTADYVNAGRVSLFASDSVYGSYGMSYDNMASSSDPLELFAGNRANQGTIGFGYDFSGAFDFSQTYNTATYVYKGSTAEQFIYENGNHLETESIATHGDFDVSTYHMGRRVAVPNGGAGYMINGKFYACLVYNRQLSNTEINDIDAHLKGLR